MTGFEPATVALQERCSTVGATLAHLFSYYEGHRGLEPLLSVWKTGMLAINISIPLAVGRHPVSWIECRYGNRPGRAPTRIRTLDSPVKSRLL